MRPFLNTKKGLRQGDSVSLILFNTIADMLALLIKSSKDDSQFVCVVPHLINEGLSILQNADDTVIFMSHHLERAKNLKLVLNVFKQLLDLKIHFHKIKLFCYGKAKECEEEYTLLFGCGIGALTFKYLGIRMPHRRLHNSEWIDVVNRFEKKPSTWKGNLGGNIG
jgi:hypothetical protein